MGELNTLLLLTGAYHSSGGIAVVNRLVIRALYELGFRAEILVLGEPCEKSQPSNPSDDSLHYRCFSGNKIRFALAAWKLLLQKKYDRVMVDHINLASLLAPLSWARQCAYLTWLFGIEVFPPRPDWQGKWGLKAATQRLAISEYTRQRVLERYPHLSIQVVELALDPERHRISDLDRRNVERLQISLTAVDGSSQDLEQQVILHVGRMETSEQYKGQDVLLEAYPFIAARHPLAQLVLVGQGSDAARLRKIALSLDDKYQPRIFMPGFVGEELLDRLYQACFLFAMPSRGEGFGLVYLEAMARARPCIGGRQDAAQYVIQDQHTGLLVENPGSAEEVAEKVVHLMDHPELARQMGLAGYERVRSNYLFPHFKERLRLALEV